MWGVARRTGGITTESGPILIVDDDPGARALLDAVLSQAGFATQQAATGEDALSSASRQRPRLVLVDIRLPQMSGYEVCRQLKDRFGEDVMVVFVSGERVESFDRAAGLLIGADDYIIKPFAPDELLARVRRLLVRSELPAEKANGQTLTKREAEVLQLLSDGLGQPAIAEKLVISSKTVSSHIQRILAKLGVHSRAQAVAAAHRGGLVR